VQAVSAVICAPPAAVSTNCTVETVVHPRTIDHLDVNSHVPTNAPKVHELLKLWPTQVAVSEIFKATCDTDHATTTQTERSENVCCGSDRYCLTRCMQLECSS